MNLNCSFLKLKTIIQKSGINHYTITEETKRDTLIKYIKEFDENQVPYFITTEEYDGSITNKPHWTFFADIKEIKQKFFYFD